MHTDQSIHFNFLGHKLTLMKYAGLNFCKRQNISKSAKFNSIFSRTSMVRTLLRPCRLVRDKGSSRQLGLMKAQGGIIKISLIFYNMQVCCVFSLRRF